MTLAHWTSLLPTVLASFMASLVEFVEALTIVLAVGLVRGWRSALTGTASALALLGVAVWALGSSLARIPLPIVQVVIGALLLLFGLRWLRKAVLRRAGVLALHDEAAAFAKETASMGRAGNTPGFAVDKIAFGATFKIVMIEGIEVIFIVVAIGAGGPLIVPASIGAAIALLAVAALGFVVHRPLARIPENTLKFGVGVLVSAFGTFWVAEGSGWSWPGGDGSILALAVVYLAVALALVRRCRQLHANARRPIDKASSPVSNEKPARRPLRAIPRHLWSLFVDDGWLAGGVLVLVGAAWLARIAVPMLPAWMVVGVFTAALNALLASSAARRARI